MPKEARQKRVAKQLTRCQYTVLYIGIRGWPVHPMIPNLQILHWQDQSWNHWSIIDHLVISFISFCHAVRINRSQKSMLDITFKYNRLSCALLSSLFRIKQEIHPVKLTQWLGRNRKFGRREEKKKKWEKGGNVIGFRNYYIHYNSISFPLALQQASSTRLNHAECTNLKSRRRRRGIQYTRKGRIGFFKPFQSLIA